MSKKLSPAQKEALARGQRIRILRGIRANLLRLSTDKAFTKEQRILLDLAFRYTKVVDDTI